VHVTKQNIGHRSPRIYILFKGLGAVGQIETPILGAIGTYAPACRAVRSFSAAFPTQRQLLLVLIDNNNKVTCLDGIFVRSTFVRLIAFLIVPIYYSYNSSKFV
jgi:hypothetical protein